MATGAASPDEAVQFLADVLTRDIARLRDQLGIRGLQVVPPTYDPAQDLWTVHLTLGKITNWFGVTGAFVREHAEEFAAADRNWIKFLGNVLIEMQVGGDETLKFLRRVLINEWKARPWPPTRPS